MDTEGSERPATSDQATTVVKSSLNNQTNGSAKPGLKLPSGSLPKAGIKGNRQPISSRPASTPHRVLSGSKKVTEQKQRVSSVQTSPGSCMSSHAKIMEKKLDAKVTKEHVSGVHAGNANGDSISAMGKAGGPSKRGLAIPKAAAQGKNPTPLRPSSTVSKRPVAAVAKVPVSRPERPLQSKSARPDATTSSHLTQSTGALRRQPVPVSTGGPRKQLLLRDPRDRSHPAQSGVLSTKPQTGKPITSLNKDVKSATSLARSSPELNKVTRAVKSTKPTSAKPSEAEGKTLNARAKGQLPKVATRSTARPQPGNATSKMPAGNIPKQSTKPLKRNVEKQSLPNKTLSSSARKPISENYVDEETRAVGLAGPLPKMPAEVESAVVNEEMSAILSSEDVAVTQGHLKIEELPSPQRMQSTPCLSNTEMIVISAAAKMEDEEVETSSWTRANAAAEGQKEDSTEAIIDLDEGNKGLSDQMTETDLNFPLNEEQNLGTPDSFKTPVKVDSSKTEAEQFNDETCTPINERTDLNNLQVQHLLAESGSTPSGKGLSQSSAEDGSPMGDGSANINGSAAPVPMLQDLAPHAGPPSECCLDDSSPEMDSPLTNVEKAKLGLYEYSEEADTEESPNELCPETLQSEDNQDRLFESPNLVETRQTRQEEGSVLPLEQKLGISSEESHEDQGVSKSSTLSGPDLAGKSSSTTSTPEELKDYDSSSGVESKSEKLESGDIYVPQTMLSPLDDLDQDLGIHLERVDEEPDTFAADDLHGDRSTEPMVSSEDEDHLEVDCERVNESSPCGLEGIDNPVFEDKTTMDSNVEALSHAASSGSFKHLTLHAVDESEELATAEVPYSIASQNCMHLAVGSSPEVSTCGQRAGLAMDHQSCGAEVSPSLENSLLQHVEDAIVPEVTFLPIKGSDLAEAELESDQSKSCDVEEPVARYPIDHLDESVINVQKLSTPTTDANGNHMLHQQQYYPACEKNDRLLTGLLGDQTPLQPHAGVPWISPPLPPILSTIYEVETAEETRLDDDLKKEQIQKPTDWQRPELMEEPSDRVLMLQIEPVKVVQQLINQTLQLSGDGMKLQSKVTVDQAELSKWTGLISPLDDSTASITSVTSFSPEDISSSQGEWTVVELETHH
ncbi:BTB/POZ domain-containing protein 8-like isoform X2 [Stegostoma tigrinum]|nr:BTB/POZ domain-containing protein 8-like isoform X2 [Stegostoma tigrinum]XP_048378088.1 BTB/POZ domain-containing protein 8-like isoform X2 [Stegostoma tigrinum]XP_048378089.1 BTB/POZ domain-containing protein 8-like isoform X2 [Stegostoma tigrinum]XP_048378090.1 BTB/POZ domain-containing protein 8-like isoform X2 [Stegostoma tigrinum]XP_048378091.1 BTB/POZ domain-containing protein 8-like isoform X2 [Stegostoma tigrinum]XP_048378092.1 BTB/POZ domain-containing protein 8-like isoform X2 [St